jgi:predicted transposase YbfD/YdcC
MSTGFSPTVEAPTINDSVVEVCVLSQRLADCFSSISDPRVERTRLHLLGDILSIAILAVIAGAQGWEGMEWYGISKQKWLSTFLALPNGIPSADTFRRVFEKLNPKEFERAFESWVRQLVDDLGVQVVSLDGKSLRGSYDRASGRKALHLVSAWASEHRLVLAQAKVQDKSNEITAIPALLELLDIAGCIVTIDAMGTQTLIAQKIIAAGADYILCLKANHPTLFGQINTWFESARVEGTLPVATEDKIESGHHRIEVRRVWSIPWEQLPPLYKAKEWSGLKTLVFVERTRQLWNKTTHEIQFYLSSLSADCPRIGSAVRQHWGIENSQHWVLDVTFNEDHSRVRSLHAPHNLALIRRFALNALNRESTRRSIRQKSLRAAMDDDFMLKVLAAAFPQLNPLESTCQ